MLAKSKNGYYMIIYINREKAGNKEFTEEYCICIIVSCNKNVYNSRIDGFGIYRRHLFFAQARKFAEYHFFGNNDKMDTKYIIKYLNHSHANIGDII